MMRFVLLAIFASSAIAQADTGTLPGGTLSFTMKTWLHENNSKANQLPIQDPTSTWEYFNLAHCQCSQFNYSDPSATLGMPWFEGNFNPELSFMQGSPATSTPVEVWTGSTCDQDVSRPTMCHHVVSADIADVQSIAAQGGLTTITVPLFDLMAPAPLATGRVCDSTTVSGTVWLLAKTMGGAYDYNITHDYAIDTRPPYSPTEYTVSGAENAIEIDFKPSTNDPTDIAYYQALCATESDQPAFTTPPFKPRYETGFTLCNAQANVALQPVTLDADGKGSLNQPTLPVDAGVDDAFAALAGSGSDAAVDAAPDAPDAPDDAPPDAAEGTVDVTALATLDKSFICGENPVPAATNVRIKNLQNGVKYKVVLLTIDKSGNASAVYFNTLMQPHAVTDFWEDLHDQGSHVQGGFCLISAAYGDDNPLTNLLRSFRDDTLGATGFGRALTAAYYATLGKLGAYVQGHLALRIVAGVLLLPLVLIALLWHFLTLPGIALLIGLACLMRRRALRMKVAQVASASLVLLLASRAHAQSPYWEDQTHMTTEDGDSTMPEEDHVTWHVGVRVGPYVPGIDSQIGTKNTAGKGPYEAMFGGYSIMPMIDVDRVLWRRVGQLGVGLSVGYMGKSAHAWVDGSDPNDPNRPRSPGDTNSFRLIPLVASAVYRFTYLDDEYGIPVVPYARAGLAYYVWWISAPSGDFAAVCKNGGMPPCTENKAAGASLGVVGSIGLAIRAERIDSSAARSMRESGIQHAGFYGELSLGKVDGFGSSTKLSVGDTTWFGGVEFEF